MWDHGAINEFPEFQLAAFDEDQGPVVQTELIRQGFVHYPDTLIANCHREHLVYDCGMAQLRAILDPLLPPAAFLHTYNV